MKIPALLIIVISLLHPSIYAQKVGEVAGIADRMAHAMLFNKHYPQEKVYLHFDNTGYFKGERIWYKAYVVRADNGMVTDISRVLYVELVSPGGDVVETQKLPVGKDGTAHGDIPLDKILGTGFYEVRAYTRYMTNWGEGGIFSRVFPVFKKPQKEGDYSRMEIDRVSYRKRLPDMRGKDADSADMENKNMRVRFYPEGGRMVKGLKSRVAFTVTDGEGRRMPSVGTFVTPNGDTDSVVTDAKGRGFLEVATEETGGRLMLKDGKGKERTFELPDAEDEGCVLSVDAVSGEDVDVRIRSSAGMCGRLLGYAVTHNGSVVECDTFTAVPEYRRSLPRVSLPEGVSQLTIFGSDGRIMADRLFFVCPEEGRESGIKTATLTGNLSPCEKVSIELTSSPKASISFSAVDCATMTGGQRGSIYTWMLLSSEVKGYIENPEYYFESDDEEHRREADMLMMTQGWRRYDWRLMSGMETFKNRIQIIEDNLYLHGRLKAFRNQNTVDNVKMNVYLYNKSGQSYSGHTKTDSMGFYAFKLPDIAGEYRMQIYTRKEGKRKTYNIAIDRRFSPLKRRIMPEELEIVPKNNPNLFTDTVENETRENPDNPPLISKNEHLLPTVKVDAKRRYFTNDDNVRWYDEHDGMYYASIYYDIDEELDKILDNGETMPTVSEFLLKRNPLFSGDTDCTMEQLEYKRRPIIWYLNNACMTEVVGKEYKTRKDVAQMLPQFLNEVKSIYIQEGIPGELEHRTHIYVYTHPTYSTESQKGLRHSYFQGFNVPTTFKTEDYSVLPPMEDFRRTIYWNPDVRTDKDGKATVEFYNNSNCTQMYVSAEGMTRDGRFVANE